MRRRQNLIEKIDRAILLCSDAQKESNKPDVYAFILRVLHEMKNVLGKGTPDSETSRRLGGGLGRYLDEFVFTDSSMEELLTEVSNEFMKLNLGWYYK